MRKTLALLTLAAPFLPVSAPAAEQTIGEPLTRHGMEIGAVYLQPVMMEPMHPGMMQPTDIHLEADIHAAKENPNGFAEGAWIPYLQIAYRIEKLDAPWASSGTFMPMVASDGPHYGANVRLDGAGRYRVTYRIAPPPYTGLYRHTDRETGVDPWWAPFEHSWELTYLGTGKKGGY